MPQTTSRKGDSTMNLKPIYKMSDDEILAELFEGMTFEEVAEYIIERKIS